MARTHGSWPYAGMGRTRRRGASTSSRRASCPTRRCSSSPTCASWRSTRVLESKRKARGGARHFSAGGDTTDAGVETERTFGQVHATSRRAHVWRVEGEAVNRLEPRFADEVLNCLQYLTIFILITDPYINVFLAKIAYAQYVQF